MTVFRCHSPLVFGEGDTKGRVKNVMGYQKPVIWMTVVAIVLAVCVGVGLLSNAKDDSLTTEADPVNGVIDEVISENDTLRDQLAEAQGQSEVAEADLMDDWLQIASNTHSYEQLYKNLNLDGIGEDDDTIFAYVASWGENGQSDCIVVSITFGTGETTAYLVRPAEYSYIWGYNIYTGHLFSEEREAVVIEVPVAYSNYGAVDIYVLDVYGASESEPPIIIERLNTEADTMRLPSGIEANLSEIVSSSNFTDGTQVVDMDGTALQGLTLYATGPNGDWREENTILWWTDTGWQVASSSR